MVERSEPFRAFRIEEDEEGGAPKGQMVDIGLSDLNEGELVVATRYSNLNYKDALAATGKGKIARRLPIVGGIDVAGTVEASEDSAFERGDEVLVTGFGLSEDRDGGVLGSHEAQGEACPKGPRRAGREARHSHRHRGPHGRLVGRSDGAQRPFAGGGSCDRDRRDGRGGQPRRRHARQPRLRGRGADGQSR